MYRHLETVLILEITDFVILTQNCYFCIVIDKMSFMAKKNTVLKKQKTPVPDQKGLMKNVKGDTLQFIIGFFLIIFSIYLFLAFLSFLVTGSADQSILDSSSSEELLARHNEIRNYAGVRGAQLANYFINHCFGYAAICIPLFLLVCGLKLMHVGHFRLWKWFISLSIALVWCSVFLAFIGLSFERYPFIYPGGMHGHVVSEWFNAQIGFPGTAMLLLVTLVAYLIYLSKQTIIWIRKAFALGMKPIKRKEESPEPGTDSAAGDTPEKTFSSHTDPSEQTVEFNLSEENKPGKDRKAEAPLSSFAEEDKMKEEFYTVDLSSGIGEKTEEEFEIIDPKEDNKGNSGIQEPAFTVETANENDEIGPEGLERYNPKLDLEYYNYPTLDLMKRYDNDEPAINMEEQRANKDRIVATLRSFGIEISNIKATVGPTVTLYEITPEAGVRISKIRNLEDDIALSLSALGIRIIAPIPGKGTIGIEVPNSNPRIVSMQSILASRKFQESSYDLPIALGKTITNDVFMVDLCKMPHVLVAGATGQGKSVGLNAIITSLLYKKHPAELKFVLVDPKKVEFSIYSAIEKHFLAKLPDAEEAIITDVTKVVQTLNSICVEMDTRYDLLKKARARNLKEYNDKFLSRRLNPNNGHKFMPYIVVIIDEFGDLIMTAGKEIELPIARIAQLARAVGIHMIIATQRPTTNIITGTIKANFPARVAFRVSSMMDSRTILDRPGANQLIGKGDMLFLQGTDPVRVQCAFVDTPEVEHINDFIAQQQSYPTAFMLPEYKGEESEGLPGEVDMGNLDPLFDDAARLLVIHQQGSTSLIQRKFAIGYNRAGRLMDQLEHAGIVGPSEGSKARQVLCVDETDLEMRLSNLRG